MTPALPLSKTCEPGDIWVTAVAEERRRHPRQPPLLREAACFADDLEGQHPLRQWEYAMALHALRCWYSEQMPAAFRLLDVGGAGSGFAARLQTIYPEATIQIIDPRCSYTIEASALPDGCCQVLTALSVLEHIPSPKPFLRACARHLAPGGLCFLTVDYWNCEGPDTAHFHWMRERIYNRDSFTDVLTFCREKLGLRRFGAADWTYHGNHVYNYTFCSLALRKER